MGNCIQEQTSVFNQWRVMNYGQQQASSNYQLLSNGFHSKILVEKWITVNVTKRQIYEMRKNSKQPHMIEIYQYGSQMSKSFQCQVYFLVTQKLIRLNQLKLSSVEAYLLLYECFEGFSSLVQYYGHFEINQKMIMINEKGQIKLWINRNLAQNRPQKVMNIEDQNKTVKSYFLNSSQWSGPSRSKIYHSNLQRNQLFGCMMKQLLKLINQRLSAQSKITLYLDQSKQWIKEHLKDIISQLDTSNCRIRLCNRKKYLHQIEQKQPQRIPSKKKAQLQEKLQNQSKKIMSIKQSTSSQQNEKKIKQIKKPNDKKFKQYEKIKFVNVQNTQRPLRDYTPQKKQKVFHKQKQIKLANIEEKPQISQEVIDLHCVQLVESRTIIYQQ